MSRKMVFKMTTLAGCGDTAKPPVEDEEPIDLDRDAIGENGVISAAKPEASEVGVEILKKGGNIIDAAIATAFVIDVVEPNATGLGGGGFMLIRYADTGEEVFLDFREVAPGNATPDMYEVDKDGKSINDTETVGGKAVGVPGEVAGLIMALEKYGTMSREEVMQPAIDYAENGFVVTKNFSDIIQDNYEKISKFEPTKEIYLKDGLPYKEGDILVNKDLANTLRKIAKEGKDAFYKGEIAQAIVDEVQRTGGIMTLEDLENYEVKVRTPGKGTYRGYEIISAPLSSSGGAHVVQLLNIMENLDLKSMGLNTTEYLHAWSEAATFMFANSCKHESGSTTHFSVMDKEGNAVAVTKTINSFFGSGVVAPGTGVLLNNEMDDFDAEPGHFNSVEPGKRPPSNMMPTILLKDGKTFMTLGSPGATRIVTAVAQVISNVVDFDMDIQEAINAPRMFDMGRGLKLEGRIDAKVVEELKAKGHDVEVKGDYDLYFGGVHGIMFEESGKLHGGADPRRDGKAVAY